MREELRLQGELAIARANGNETEEKRLQRLLDIQTLTEQMTRAQIDGAEAAATAQVDAIIAGMTGPRLAGMVGILAALVIALESDQAFPLGQLYALS